MTPYLKGTLLTLSGVAVLSLDALLIRLINADPWTLLFWRGLLLSACLGWLCRRQQRAPRRLRWGSALCYACTTITFVLAIRLTSVANTLIIMSVAPLLSALLSRVWLGEKTAPATWLAMLLCSVGLALVMSAGSQSSLTGDISALLCATSMAVKLVLDRAARPVSMAPSLVPAGLLIAIVALSQAPTLQLPAHDMLWMALLGLGVVPLAYLLISQGPRYLPAAEVGLLMLLEMLLGPLWVWLVLAEAPAAAAWLGGSIILAALLLQRCTAIRKPVLASLSTHKYKNINNCS